MEEEGEEMVVEEEGEMVEEAEERVEEVEGVEVIRRISCEMRLTRLLLFFKSFSECHL